MGFLRRRPSAAAASPLTALRFFQYSQKLSRAYDWDALKRTKHQQILIPSHDVIRISCHCRFQHHVIRRVPAGLNSSLGDHQKASYDQ